MADGERLPVVYEEDHDVERRFSNIDMDSEKLAATRPPLHVAFFIAQWITLSSATILFNKYVLTGTGFNFPIILTSWHMVFATAMTQVLARFTHLLDSRHNIPMTTRTYFRIILPIGLLFSLCLMCGNVAYIYLTVSFIQMLKASMPVVTILVSCSVGRTPFSLATLANAAVIAFGVLIASYGEVQFVLIGVLIQLSSVLFDALRLVLTQQLLSTAMDPLVLMFYLSPLCAVINTLFACFGEVSRFTVADIQNVGYLTLLANASVAFALNVATVVLISKTSSLAMTLCGVLKNILIVSASMLFFHDPVSLLQALGYSIALAGLVYYQIGGDSTNMEKMRSFANKEKMREILDKGSRAWKEVSDRSPARFWLTILASILIGVVGLYGALALTGAVPVSYYRGRFEAANMFGAVEDGKINMYTDMHGKIAWNEGQ